MIRRFFLLFSIPILLYASQSEILNKSNSKKLYNKNEWKALLHYDNKLNILDNNFIFSNKNFSLKNELNSTIKSFYAKKEKYKNINNHPQCKFPSRLLFVVNELNIDSEEFPKINCPNLNNYRQKAPMENISLIYASEKVNSPSSMMGHSFLKYTGINSDNQEKMHAISFYTIVDSFNIFKLTYQNMISGMNGLFSLKPYSETIRPYIEEENRNIWEYRLSLSEYRKKLIYYHVWELKDIRMKYFFTKYNCSTVIYYLLSLGNPKIYDENKLWVTPLDTVKFIYKYDLVKNTKLLPSDQWLIKMLEENIDIKKLKKLNEIIENKKYEEIPKLDFYSLKLLEIINKNKYLKKGIDINEYNSINSILLPLKTDNIIDISKYKQVKNIPHERQLSLGYSSVNNQNYTKISFLPASHLLNDNNYDYFGESELKVASLSILLNREDIKLEEFVLYGMKSYMPTSTFSNDLSYEFELSIKKEFNKSKNYVHNSKISGGVGIDFSLGTDINLFAILNTGVAYNRIDGTHWFLKPKIGGIIYEIFNMKSLIYYEPLITKKKKDYGKYILNHNIFLSKNYKLYFNFEQINNREYQNYEFGLTKLF
jgi:hypothetical protein